MNTEAVTAPQSGIVGLESIDAHRDINRIALAVIDRRIKTSEGLTAECVEVAHEHYVEIVEVYRRVWEKVAKNRKLHSTHPAGKTEAYHTLRKRAQH